MVEATGWTLAELNNTSAKFVERHMLYLEAKAAADAARQKTAGKGDPQTMGKQP